MTVASLYKVRGLWQTNSVKMLPNSLEEPVVVCGKQILACLPVTSAGFKAHCAVRLARS